jgi:hypothetical protein
MPTTSIINGPTITALSDVSQTDIIKLYNDINLTGSIKIFNVISANSINISPVLSIYDSTIDTIPPKSLEIIQPLNNQTSVSNYNYYIGLKYVFSDNSNYVLYEYNSLNSIELTKTLNISNGTPLTGNLRNIFVYKQIN